MLSNMLSTFFHGVTKKPSLLANFRSSDISLIEDHFQFTIFYVYLCANFLLDKSNTFIFINKLLLNKTNIFYIYIDHTFSNHPVVKYIGWCK